MNRDWLIAEPTTRWLRLVRRFGPAMLPAVNDRLNIASLESAQMVGRVIHTPAAVVLWSLETEASAAANLKTLGSLLQQPLLHRTLHFVAVDPRLSETTRLALLTWGVAVIDRPEQLPQRAPLVTRFWRNQPPRLAAAEGIS